MLLFFAYALLLCYHLASYIHQTARRRATGSPPAHVFDKEGKEEDSEESTGGKGAGEEGQDAHGSDSTSGTQIQVV